MQDLPQEIARTRRALDELDGRLADLVKQRDEIVRELIRHKGRAPYDPEREQQIAASDEALWLPLLRRMRISEGARELDIRAEPGAFPADEFTLIAGPCSVDEHLEQTLDGLVEAGVGWARAGAWKPRTFPWSFQGSGMQGLRRLRAAADTRGLRVVSEIVSERDAAEAAELVDVVQVGARNCQNFALLKTLATLGTPVLLKRGPAATIEEWLGAAEYLHGRVPVTLCERGVRGFDPCLRNTLDLAGALLARRLSGFQVIVDPSHATGIAGLVTPLVLAAHAAGLDGAMVEAHACPPESPSDAEQALTVGELGELCIQLRALQPQPARV